MPSGEGDALPGSPQCAQVHRSPLQRQETQLHRRVHKGRNVEGDHQENGEKLMKHVAYCVCFDLISKGTDLTTGELKCKRGLCLQDSNYPWNQRVSIAKDIAAGMVSFKAPEWM